MSTHARVDYENFRKIAPAANAALAAVGKAVDDSGLEKELTELIKLRASQSNGCAFCAQYHLNGARKLGIASEKLDLVAVWRDAGIFSARERAALAWTEALTDLADHAASDEIYVAAREQFTETEIVFLTVAVGMINTWNRLGVALRFSPPIPHRAATAA